ncbi:class I adenylate cyclase [Sedimenticola selenatireducens]|uniref:class I adenylate cyclase n=1 Tax=Sedimenticola selenatireducens TaxID=191960 RepID=UPI002AAB7A3A|nr:class I adenylate cyclase [Sedimenticola selenatireducens]
MAEAVSYEDGIGRQQLLTVRRRFLGLHRERLRIITRELTPNQRIFIDLLPLLFHINHPTLPGFAGSDTPIGIPDYAPTQAVLRLARKLSRSFEYKKRARRRFHIQALYLMGSIGSIAHTRGSDFDIWLCHDPELDRAARDLLRLKARKIEAWGKELNLEVHFFLMDVDAFRGGKLDTLSHESSGTTQPHLLLEEFYRTGVLLAGRYPVWWMVPPEEEANYTRYVSMLFHKRFIDPLDCLDFGSLEAIPVEEFLGAAHWQLFKGIESPYKTILKLFLTEAYARDYPDIRWLCHETKQAIYSGDFDLRKLDPYVLMYQRVEQYLLGRGEKERLELARRCLYFKSEQTLSRERLRPRDDWKREVLQALTKDWGWRQGELVNLDSRHSWKIDQVMDERNNLVRELSYSYRLLTDFAREYASTEAIDPEEISLLGRKLYTALEKRPGKIDSINPGITRSLYEARISLHYARTKGEQYAWFLYLGEVNEQAARVTSPLKTAACLSEILAWCHLNRLINLTTIVTLYPQENPVRQAELGAILGALSNIYQPHESVPVPMARLKQPPYALSCTLFLNTGIDPMAYLAKVGKQLTTERSDPLSFGSAHSSLVETVEQLITTSWGETLVTYHQGTRGLLECLCHYLRMALQGNAAQQPPRATAHCFNSVRGGSTARRVEKLFNDVLNCFSAAGSGLNSRYLQQIEDDFYLIHYQNEKFSYFPIAGEQEALDILAEPQHSFRPTTIDSLSLAATPLPCIMRLNRAGAIQVFYSTRKGQTELYILDEHGALFHQQMQEADEHYLLVQQQRFLKGMLLLRSLSLPGDQPAHRYLLDAPEFYHLQRNRDGEYLAEPRTPPRHRLPDSYMELRLISEGLDLNQAPHLLVCGDREFSSLEYGAELYSVVAQHLLDQRIGHKAYPIYLTSLELAGFGTEENATTIQLLKFKKRLEGRLNQALMKLSR